MPTTLDFNEEQIQKYLEFQKETAKQVAPINSESKFIFLRYKEDTSKGAYFCDVWQIKDELSFSINTALSVIGFYSSGDVYTYLEDRFKKIDVSIETLLESFKLEFLSISYICSLQNEINFYIKENSTQEKLKFYPVKGILLYGGPEENNPYIPFNSQI
jgi:hypothetical protein